MRGGGGGGGGGQQKEQQHRKRQWEVLSGATVKRVCNESLQVMIGLQHYVVRSAPDGLQCLRHLPCLKDEHVLAAIPVAMLKRQIHQQNPGWTLVNKGAARV